MSKKFSEYWKFFEQTGDVFSSKCRICDKVVKTTGGSVSNLKRHISRNHKHIPLPPPRPQWKNWRNTATDASNTVYNPDAVETPSISDAGGSTMTKSIALTVPPASSVMRRQVDVVYFIRSLQKLNRHGNDGCNFSDMDLKGEVTDDSKRGVLLSCRKCSTSTLVWLEDPETIPSQTSSAPPPSETTLNELMPLSIASSIVEPQISRTQANAPNDPSSIKQEVTVEDEDPDLTSSGTVQLLFCEDPSDETNLASMDSSGISIMHDNEASSVLTVNLDLIKEEPMDESSCRLVPMSETSLPQVLFAADVLEPSTSKDNHESPKGRTYSMLHRPLPQYSKVVEKKNTKSKVWLYFGLPADENDVVIDNSTIICKICTKRVTAKTGNTTNLMCHLKLHHPMAYKRMTNKIIKQRVRRQPFLDMDHRRQRSARASGGMISFSDGQELFLPSSAEILNYSKLVSREGKNVTSPVWKHFGLPADENGTVISKKFLICKICLCYYYSTDRNISSMLSHLKVCHSEVFYGLYDGSENSSGDVVDLISEDMKEDIVTNNDFLKPCSVENCISSIAKFLVFTFQPYHLVEMKYFTEMIKSINPSYKIPPKKFFTKTEIPKLYDEMVDTIKQKTNFKELKDISMSIDRWTSDSNICYMTVVIHFIDNQWNLKSTCLNCSGFEVDHTFENMSGILYDWDLPLTNVTCCSVGDMTKIETALVHFGIRNISCFGQNLNVAINRALNIDASRTVISKLKKLQNEISRSLEMRRDLTKTQENLEMKISSLPSISSSRSCWSTLKLIRKFLLNEVPIRKMLDNQEQRCLMLDEREILVLKDVVTNTQLLADITTTLSEPNEYISASTILPLYRKIKKNLQLKDSDSDASKLIKSNILTSLSNVYENKNMETILWMTSLCDPRFRLNFTDCASETKAVALQEMTDIYERIDSLSSELAQNGTEKKGLEKLFDFDDTSDNDSLPESKARTELGKYLAMSKVGLNVNPIAWWKSNEDSFPVLKTLAKKYLAIQGSSSPSEMLFTKKGDMLLRQRAAVPPKYVKMQAFLAANKDYIP